MYTAEQPHNNRLVVLDKRGLISFCDGIENRPGTRRNENYLTRRVIAMLCSEGYSRVWYIFINR